MKRGSGLAMIAAALLLTGCVATTAPTTVSTDVYAVLDPSLPPTYGSSQVPAGVAQTVQIQAGGSVDARTLGSHCIGFIYYAADYAVDHVVTAGAAPLMFTAISREDTTLVVRDPQGRYHCNDDVTGTLDTQLRITGATTGRYLVWVGTYQPITNLPPATLYINH